MRLLPALAITAACSDGTQREPVAPRTPDERAAVEPTMRELHGHHHEGDRTGVHGMVVFGKRQHYLEHIPTFSRPHNEQLVMRVTLKTAQGLPLDADFSDQGYSMQPTSKLSLDDVALRKQVDFTADIHRGNFEADGPLLHHAVRVTVDAVLVARNLPGDERIADGEQEYLLVGEPGDAYLTNYIRGSRGFQQVLRVVAIEGVTPSRTRVHHLKAKAAYRLAAASAVTAELPEAGAIASRQAIEASPVTLALGPELWCLQAPDFVEPCR